MKSKEEERITESIFRLILITGIALILLPSVIYAVLVFWLGYTVPMRVAIFFMVFSATSNMAIWIIAVITAYKSTKATEKLGKYADNVLKSFGFLPPNLDGSEEDDEIESGVTVREDSDY